MIVAQLIEELQKFPSDMLVAVYDADTTYVLDDVSVLRGHGEEDPATPLCVIDGGKHDSSERGRFI